MWRGEGDGERREGRSARARIGLSVSPRRPAPFPSFSISLAHTHMVAPLHQVGAQVGTHEAGPARDEDAVGLDAGLGLDDRRFLWRERGEEGA